MHVVTNYKYFIENMYIKNISDGTFLQPEWHVSLSQDLV